MLCGFTFALAALTPESLAPVLLRRKAKKIRKTTGNPAYKAMSELNVTPLSERLKVAIARPLIMMFAEPIIFFLSIYLSFIYGLLYLLFFAFPIAFEEVRGWNPGMTGVAFVSIIVSFGDLLEYFAELTIDPLLLNVLQIGILIAGCVLPIQEKLYARATTGGLFYPEARLYPMMFGSLTLPIALFIFAFTGGYSWVHWMGPMVAGTIFGFSMILIYVSANS